MIFHPQNLTSLDGTFAFSGEVTATAHACINRDIVKEFWHNFAFTSSTLTVAETERYIFSVGNASPLPLDGCDWTIHVTHDGICVFAESEQNLLLGFMTLLDRFHAVDTSDGCGVEIACCEIREMPLIKTRMVHFCIFPETELWELRRFVRLCAALRYTHVVLEFWGTLRLDCLKELAWPGSFTKEDIRPIITEANGLGLEVIPMFNHWGHASAGREMHGKHVVLDQNPSLQTYFDDNGWCWDIKKPKVRELLGKIRQELIDLCGDGSYFHIGCDEAYGFSFTKENMDFICDYINGISRELQEQNRRVISWGDMFLHRHEHYNKRNNYACSAPTAEDEAYMLAHLDRAVMIGDWQYESPEAPIETAAVFQNAGFDCLLCPWDRGGAKIKSAITTVRDQGLTGVLHTTWHTLSAGMPAVLLVALGCFEDISELETWKLRIPTASVVRRVMPVNGDYEKAGWSKHQVAHLW